MLIVSITDPEVLSSTLESGQKLTNIQKEFFHNLFELTVRHIRYGVRAEYLSPFGQAVIAMLEEVRS